MTAPRNPDVLDNIGYTQRVVDAILRNNPLTDAVVSEGLIRWNGNYTTLGDTNKVDLLWIGEFYPADPNLPGSPPQRGFVLRRDDSRGGAQAVTMYDPNPSLPGGLKQALFFDGGDRKQLAAESRDGGWKWPEENVAMAPLGSNLVEWTGTTLATFDTLYEGRMNVVGRGVSYRIFCAGTGGAAGDFRVRVEGITGDVSGPTHTLAAGTANAFEGTIDVSASRGSTVPVRFEARVTNGVGAARGTPISIRCYTA